MSHTYTQLFYHLVWSTKERQPLLLPHIRPRLFGYLGAAFRETGGICIQVGGVEDHVHVLTSIPARIAVATAMGRIKTAATKWLRQEQLVPADFAWQEGYGAFSVSRSKTDAVTAYIQNQEEHHKTQTFEAEFLGLLEKHGVDYDPKYLWK